MNSYGNVSINRNSNLNSKREDTLKKMKNITAQYYNLPTFENKGTLKQMRASKNSL